MEIILTCIVAVSMVVSVIVYAYLVENKKIEPMPPRFLGRHGGFEVKYTEEDYKKFDKEEEVDTVQRQSDSKKLQLEEEAKDNQVIGIDTRIKDGKWTKQITTYASGRTVTEYADKREEDSRGVYG